MLRCSLEDLAGPWKAGDLHLPILFFPFWEIFTLLAVIRLRYYGYIRLESVKVRRNRRITVPEVESWVKNKSRRKKQRKSLQRPRRRKRLPNSRRSNKTNDSWTKADDLTELQKAAAEGKPGALYALGSKNEQGLGIVTNLRRAAGFYRKAAEQNHLDAQLAMARLCLLGKGVQQDAAEAAEWYRRAAEQGHVESQFNLAEMYHLGRGIEQDDEQAAHWYKQAAESGMLDAQIR